MAYTSCPDYVWKNLDKRQKTEVFFKYWKYHVGWIFFIGICLILFAKVVGDNFSARELFPIAFYSFFVYAPLWIIHFFLNLYNKIRGNPLPFYELNDMKVTPRSYRDDL